MCLSENCRDILLRKNDCEVLPHAHQRWAKTDDPAGAAVRVWAFTQTRPVMLGANIEGRTISRTWRLASADLRREQWAKYRAQSGEGKAQKIGESVTNHEWTRINETPTKHTNHIKIKGLRKTNSGDLSRDSRNSQALSVKQEMWQSDR